MIAQPITGSRSPPRSHTNTRAPVAVIAIDQRAARRIGDRVEHEPAIAAGAPPRGLGVALDHLAQAVDDRLDEHVARGEPVRRDVEHRRRRERGVERDRLLAARAPARRATRSQPSTQRQRRVAIEPLARSRGSRRTSTARAPERARHEPRTTGSARCSAVQVSRLSISALTRAAAGGQPLALLRRQRAPHRPDRREHRDPERVEPGQLGDPRDPRALAPRGANRRQVAVEASPRGACRHAAPPCASSTSVVEAKRHPAASAYCYDRRSCVAGTSLIAIALARRVPQGRRRATRPARRARRRRRSRRDQRPDVRLRLEQARGR